MFIEKMFGNLFGIVWLVIFVLGVFALLIWLFVKKDKSESDIEIEEKNVEIVAEEENKGANANIEVEKEVPSKSESIYEVVEIDGFFKVRKKDSDRTIRKFSTSEEAYNYVKEKESND